MPLIEIPVGDATAEAWLSAPPATDGPAPGVLLYIDAFGLRPRIEDMAAEIASWGYVVLAPNVFYRDGSVEEVAPTGDLSTPEGREAFWKVAGPRIGHLSADLAVKDNAAYLETLQALPGVTPATTWVPNSFMARLWHAPSRPVMP